MTTTQKTQAEQRITTALHNMPFLPFGYEVSADPEVIASHLESLVKALEEHSQHHEDVTQRLANFEHDVAAMRRLMGNG